MSIKVMNRVWEQSKVKGSQRLVLLAIADNANDHGHGYPGIEGALAKKTLLTGRAVGYNIDKLALTTEIGVYPNPGTSHDYIVFVGMTLSEAKTAIRKLAQRRGLTTKEMARLRKDFRAAAAERQGKMVKKTFRTTSETSVGGDPKTASDEPSVTVREPSEPKGCAVAQPSSTNEKKSPPSKKGRGISVVDPRGIPINKKHPRWNELWDAIVDVTGVDVGIRTNRANLGRVVKEILQSEVEYTGEDIQAAPKWWKAENFPGRVTVNALPKWLQDIRAYRLKSTSNAPKPYVPKHVDVYVPPADVVNPVRQKETAA